MILFRAVATCVTLPDPFPPAVRAATALPPSLPRRQRQPRPPVSPPPRRHSSPAQAHLPLCQPLRHPLVPAPHPAEGRASGPVPGHPSPPARSCTWNPTDYQSGCSQTYFDGMEHMQPVLALRQLTMHMLHRVFTARDCRSQRLIGCLHLLSCRLPRLRNIVQGLQQRGCNAGGELPHLSRSLSLGCTRRHSPRQNMK